MEPGDVARAVFDNVVQPVGRGTTSSWRDERRPTETVAHSSFPVTLRAVFLEDRIRGQARGRRLSLSQGYDWCQKNRAHGNCDPVLFHIGPLRNWLARNVDASRQKTLSHLVSDHAVSQMR